MRRTAGAWQHYLPASFLSGFAETMRRPARDSLLWVGRRGVRPYLQKAGNIAAAQNIYTLAQGPFEKDAVDRIWGSVEPRLRLAIDHFLLKQDHVDALVWSVVMVRFVAQLFVRGVDFEIRYRERAARVAKVEHPELKARPLDSDDINNVRIYEMARLVGGIMCANWEVCYTPPGLRLITNDIGRAHLVRPKAGDGDELCSLIPLRHDAALVISYRGSCYAPQRTKQDRWAIGPLPRRTLPEDEVHFLNTALAEQAWAEFYGATEELVRALHPKMREEGPDARWIEPLNFLQTRTFELRNSERYWPQFFEYIQTPPSRTTKRFRPMPYLGGVAVYEFYDARAESDASTKPFMQAALSTATMLKWKFAERHRNDLLSIPITDSRYGLASAALTKMAVIESGQRDPRYGGTAIAELIADMTELGLARPREVEPDTNENPSVVSATWWQVDP